MVCVCVAEFQLWVLGCPTETEGMVAVLCHEAVNVMIYKGDYLQLDWKFKSFFLSIVHLETVSPLKVPALGGVISFLLFCCWDNITVRGLHF